MGGKRPRRVGGSATPGSSPAPSAKAGSARVLPRILSDPLEMDLMPATGRTDPKPVFDPLPAFHAIQAQSLGRWCNK